MTTPANTNQTPVQSGTPAPYSAESARLWNALEEIGDLCDGREDIDDNGNPNFAMRIRGVIDQLGGGLTSGLPNGLERLAVGDPVHSAHPLFRGLFIFEGWISNGPQRFGCIRRLDGSRFELPGGTCPLLWISPGVLTPAEDAVLNGIDNAEGGEQ